MSTPMHMTNCPSEETLAAFIDGRLDPEARQRVVEHVATCEDCYAIVSAAWDFQAAEPATEAPGGSGSGVGSEGRGAVGGRVVRGRFGGRVWWVGAAAAVAAAAVVLFLSPTIHDSLFPPKTGIAALVKASEILESRRVEGRLSGGFPYKRLRIMRGPQDGSEDSRAWKLMRIDAQAGIDARNDRRPANLHTFGVSQLLLGKTDSAIDSLESAIEEETERPAVNEAISASTNADLLNDLSVAYASRARSDRNKDLALGLAAATRSVTVRPSDESRYNRALLIEMSGLEDAASEAWLEYLAHDSTSPWAMEARQRLRSLNPNGPDRSPRTTLDYPTILALTHGLPAASEQARTYCEQTLLSAWANAVLSHNHARAVELLSWARDLGQAIVRKGGDESVADTVSAIEKVSDANLIDLAKAHKAYGDAYLAMRAASTVATANQLRVVGDQLTIHHSPLALRAYMFCATVEHYLGKNETAAARLDVLVSKLSRLNGRYPSIAGQVRWTRGLVAYAIGSPYEARQFYETARADFIAAGERSNLAGVESVLGEVCDYLGAEDEAWRYTLKALNDAAAAGTHRRYYLTLGNCAQYAVRQRLLPLSEFVNTRLTLLAETGHDPLEIADAARIRSSALAASGADSEAARTAESGLHAIFGAPLSGSRMRLEADLQLQHAWALVESDPTRALEEFSDAASVFDSMTNRVRTAKLKFGVGTAYVYLRNYQLAKEQFAEGLSETIRESESIVDPQWRVSTIETGRELADQLIVASIRNGTLRDAFESSDQLKFATSGIVAETLPHGTDSIAELMLLLGRTDIAVAYYSLPDELLAWIIRHDRPPLLMRTRISRAHLKMLVDRTVRDVSGAITNEVAATASAQLYNVLLRPVIQSATSANRLIVLPDSFLFGVPFAALYDSEAGVFAVERQAIVIARSARELITRSLAPQTKSARKASRLVVVGPVAVGRVDQLPGAAAEASMIADDFEVDVLSGPAATPAALLAHLKNYNSVQIGCHATDNKNAPGFAALVLSPDSTHPDGFLYAHELSGSRLNHIQIVILAACDSASGRQRTGGSDSLVRAFRNSGVSNVIGTLWPIDDAETALFVKLDGNLKMYAPAEALARSQRELIKQRTVPPSSWASASLFGLI